MNGASFPTKMGIAQAPVYGSNNVQQQLDQAAQEEMLCQAPRILPFALENIHQFLGNTYVNLMQIKSQLTQAENDPEINKEALKEVQELIDNINKQIVVDLPVYLHILEL